MIIVRLHSFIPIESFPCRQKKKWWTIECCSTLLASNTTDYQPPSGITITALLFTMATAVDKLAERLCSLSANDLGKYCRLSQNNKLTKRTNHNRIRKKTKAKEFMRQEKRSLSTEEDKSFRICNVFGEWQWSTLYFLSGYYMEFYAHKWYMSGCRCKMHQPHQQIKYTLTTMMYNFSSRHIISRWAWCYPLRISWCTFLLCGRNRWCGIDTRGDYWNCIKWWRGTSYDSSWVKQYAR